MTDPFSIEDLTMGAQRIGEEVLYLPRATYPISIRGLGGRSIEYVRRLRDELTAALELADGR